MRHTTWLIWALALGALLALAAPARAGGWAVVTLDALPREVYAAQPLSLGFMVRQHGRTPISNVAPLVLATRVDLAGPAADAAALRVAARQQGQEGHFVVDLVFPSAGVWAWKIAPEPFGPTELGQLTVLASAAPGAGDVSALAWAWPSGLPLLMRGAGALLLGAAAILAAWRVRGRGAAPKLCR